MSDETKATALAEHLVSITANLATYIEEQAQAIAQPKITAALNENNRLLIQWQVDASARDQRNFALLDELRRHIAALEKQVKSRDAVLAKVRAFADALPAKGAEDIADALRSLWHGSGVRP